MTDGWDRSRCLETGCYCHDPNVIPHYCNHCGCKPAGIFPERIDEQVIAYVGKVQVYRDLSKQTERAHRELAMIRRDMTEGQLEQARHAIRGQA